MSIQVSVILPDEGAQIIEMPEDATCLQLKVKRAFIPQCIFVTLAPS